MNELMTLLKDALKQNTFIKGIWSNPRRKESAQKIVIRPVLIKEVLMLQITQTVGQKELHENITLQEIEQLIHTTCNGYKQVQLYTSQNDYACLVNKKGNVHIKKLAPTLKVPNSLSHNRQKNYLLDTPSSHDFLKALGLMDEKGHIKPSKYDKYKQINRYLEFVADCTDVLTANPIRIIDFGCGKSYLTFALYHYLTVILLLS